MILINKIIQCDKRSHFIQLCCFVMIGAPTGVFTDIVNRDGLDEETTHLSLPNVHGSICLHQIKVSSNCFISMKFCVILKLIVGPFDVMHG